MKSVFCFQGNKGFDVGGFFMGFNKDTLQLFQGLITEDLYYKNYDVAETLLSNISKVLPCKISSHTTEDEIYFYDNLDLFNYSSFSSFKFFLHKRTLSNDTAKIFFYDIHDDLEISINFNDKNVTQIISNHTLIDSEIHHDDVHQISIIYNGIKQDLTTQYNNISHNKIIISNNVDCQNL